MSDLLPLKQSFWHLHSGDPCLIIQQRRETPGFEQEEEKTEEKEDQEHEEWMASSRTEHAELDLRGG